MRLFIAEKPSVAKAIVTELGSTTPGDGFFNCKDGSTVTWCFGHLLEQAEPDAYLPDDVPLTKKGANIWRFMRDVQMVAVNCGGAAGCVFAGTRFHCS